MKALRLPTRASAVAHWFAPAAPRDPPSFVFALALPKGRRSLRRPGPLFSRRPFFRLLSRGRGWDLSGLQAIRPVPLLRSWTPAEPTCPRHTCGHVDAAPTALTAKASAMAISGLTRSFSTCCRTLHAWRCRRTCKACFRLAGWPLPGGSRTPWIAARGFSSYRSSSSPALLTRQRYAGPCLFAWARGFARLPLFSLPPT
jgi:hypothetical protein